MEIQITISLQNIDSFTFAAADENIGTANLVQGCHCQRSILINYSLIFNLLKCDENENLVIFTQAPFITTLSVPLRDGVFKILF